MRMSNIAVIWFFALIAGVLSSEVKNAQKEPLPLQKSLSDLTRSFNPLSPGSWFSLPSQVLQYWFPLFRPAYYPTNLQQQKPAAAAAASKENKTESESEYSKPKTENIFEVSDSKKEDAEYLPSANKIEW